MCVRACVRAPRAGLYKGLLPNIIKLAPAAGISWYVFEESKQVLGLDPRA
jgi:solute carrier family 25 phosphate transporter 23/24/25/41